ncbi:phosphatidylserine decarboxylase [Halomonas sp. ZH2S]|uniref:Phosphatidylserine decarboxylase proenzyme n=1 Tax=Vreelandella zhuhanensis TaxID=2684210 RepID=A0A7X3GYI4_9GAMM|nr:archaetidylserine decarboxylase [Halomonas zhuhanensis]MWJ26904.1 phosphatidylserine decarboxylase [Halomonas zhuhanensis]
MVRNTFPGKLFSLIQYPLPHHAISRAVGRLADCSTPWLKNALIRAFIKRFNVDMSQALEPDPTAYATFNAFFTRALKADARPLEAGLLCSTDGTLSQYGKLEDGQLVQAKGHRFSAQTLLGGDPALAEEFSKGSFATVYLSPSNYHRVHMPLTGTLRETIYVPGRIFSVNQATAANVPNLFARNERLVCIFDTQHGPMAMVLVGAMIVAAIETAWAGQVTPLSGTPQRTRFDRPIQLEKGEEMGLFKLGSTVVTCFANPVEFADLTPNSMVQMGQSIGTISDQPSAISHQPSAISH